MKLRFMRLTLKHRMVQWMYQHWWRRKMLFNIDIIECNNPKEQAQDLVSGLQKLGKGCFATVYASDHNQVIKISEGQDWGYISFLEAMSQQRTHNPWLPRIQWAKVFMSNTGKEQDNRVVTCLEHLERPWKDCGTIDDEHDSSAEYWQKCVVQCKEIESHMSSGRNQKDWINQNQELSAALQVVRQAMRACGRNVDMHCGNFMLRGRQLVITDPIGF